MIFSCFPPNIECEWADIRFFVDRYNNTFKKTYRRSKCLDKTGEHGKQPELLLEAPGEVPIVIERKSVVWPSDHLRGHRNEHNLHDFFLNRVRSLGDPFTDSVYQLTVSAKSLRRKSKKEVQGFAEQIADKTLLDQFTAKSPSGIFNQQPIPWRFRPLSPQEKDETVPDTGIGLIVREDLVSFEQSEILQGTETAKAGYAKEFERLAKAAAEKFAKYSDCERLLLVQFYGDSSVWLDVEETIEIIKSAQLPEMIDQVWLAGQEWVSESDYEISWEHVR